MSAKAAPFAATFVPLTLSFDFPGRAGSKYARGLAANLPRGPRRCWGIPFRLAAKNKRANVLRLSRGRKAAIDVGPARIGTTHVCFLHYWEGKYSPDAFAEPGELLARYRLVYTHGAPVEIPVRYRYEVGSLSWPWGFHPFRAVRMDDMRTFDFMNVKTLPPAGWGGLQTDATGATGPAWIFAFENPRPKTPIARIEFEGLHKDAVALAAVTLYAGPGHPLRHNRRAYYRVELPRGEEVASMDVDMGVLVRDAGAAVTRDEQWLTAVDAGLGANPAKMKPQKNVRLIEASAADAATLTVKSSAKRRKAAYRLSLGEAFHAGQSRDGKARLAISDRGETWVRVSLRDADTGHPVAARVHLSGPSGEYYAPYGHHTVINANWFEDYGADVKLGAMNFAYVRGDFSTKLPVGELYIEAAQGFEYEPLRERVVVAPGQKELTLTMRRWTDRSKDGWVTADTHVHFISPHTAWLQGQCEGLNLINLLASQWGRLFTNVGDITGEVGVDKDRTIVWVGTENRNHMLGHISMLGTHGDPVYPMCAGGPTEAYVGDPDERAMGEWADECRRKEGVVVRPHFPSPNVENAADIVLGKYDALEIRNFYSPRLGPLDRFTVGEYHRYLNCGCRVACVGGTDKMSAGMPVGGVRTYAKLDPNRPFDFANWAAAVRAGRTFSTSGPLIDLTVDGRSIGEEITLTGGRGSVEVCAVAECAWPIHRLEIIMNGRTVAVTESKDGAKRLEIREKLSVTGSSWIAATCGSSMKVQHCWPIYLAAHTSPVYVVVPGTDLFSPSDATYMLTLIDGGLTYLDTLSVRFSEERHRAMKAIFKAARRKLMTRF